MTEPLQTWQDFLDISPFQRWLGLKVEEAGEGRLVIGLEWREEFVSNPNNKSMHGGILASLIDLGGLYAILTTKSMATATVDLRVDYHRPATGGDSRHLARHQARLESLLRRNRNHGRGRQASRIRARRLSDGLNTPQSEGAATAAFRVSWSRTTSVSTPAAASAAASASMPAE
ncbi:MAG: PaaI family thioesterase [Parvibaculum sp.]|uniref:PaaI family thioesterase n=1 Tax=Parvibaculum sp. TaxID=2024848 RepID=UPI003C715E3E